MSYPCWRKEDLEDPRFSKSGQWKLDPKRDEKYAVIQSSNRAGHEFYYASQWLKWARKIGKIPMPDRRPGTLEDPIKPYKIEEPDSDSADKKRKQSKPKSESNQDSSSRPERMPSPIYQNRFTTEPERSSSSRNKYTSPPASFYEYDYPSTSSHRKESSYSTSHHTSRRDRERSQQQTPPGTIDFEIGSTYIFESDADRPDLPSKLAWSRDYNYPGGYKLDYARRRRR